MCALFGGQRDISLFTSINKEYINDIIQQEIAYYKVSLKDTEVDIYGDVSEQGYIFEAPVLLNSLVYNRSQEDNTDEFGSTVRRQVSFAFLKSAFEERELLPEKGDVIVWQNLYFEVYNRVKNQFIFGKEDQTYITNYLKNFGKDFGVVLEAIQVPADKYGIELTRL